MTTTEDPIQKTPDVMGGEACIRRTRISVWMLVQARKLGISDEQLLSSYRGLTFRRSRCGLGLLPRASHRNRAGHLVQRHRCQL